MTLLLNAVPFPFNRPDAQELLSKLTTLYSSRQAAISIAEDTGLDTSQLFFDQAVTFVWREILRKAAVDGLVRGLVQNVFDRLTPTNSARSFFTELLANQPVALTEDPHTPDGAPIFIANDDQIQVPESLLYHDDLMVQIGRVPQLIKTLQRLVELAPSVCRLSVDVKGTSQFGTGFRIESSWLLTNWHVVHNRNGVPANTITAEFGYEDNGSGGLLASTMITCELPLIASSQADDWAVVQITQPLSNSIPIIKLTEAAIPQEEEMAYVIQHPNGDRKRLAYVRNQISYVDDRVIHYLADTQAGSSGSPVFNADGQLIGLHHAGGRPQEVIGKAPLRKNEGIRISRVVEGLAEKGIRLDNI